MCSGLVSTSFASIPGNEIAGCSGDVLGFPGSSACKESTCNAGDPGSIPGLERSPGEGIGYLLQYSWASLVAQMVNNLPAMQVTSVRFLGWEDSLEEGMTTHSSTLAGESLWTEEPDGYSPWGRKEFDMTERLSTVQGRCAINQNTSTVAFLRP